MKSGKGSALALGRRYARALFDLTKPQELEVLEKALQAAAEIWSSDNDFRDFIQNPSITLGSKQDLLQELRKALNIELETFERFLALLAQNGRIWLLPQIAKSYSALVDERKKVICLEIISAVSLPDSEKESIVSSLKNEVGGMARVEWQVEPEIIGGLVIKSGDKMVDRSVKGMLLEMRNSLYKS